MLEVLDAAALRRWCRTSLDLLGREREHIDALNVFPVADADTGTNLFLTVEAACEAAEAGAELHPDDFAAALHDVAHGAFLGARGNSGVILSQILRGMAEAVAPAAGDRSAALTGVSGKLLGVAFARAAKAAYAAVEMPADGTILTVVRDASEAVAKARSDDLGAVVQVALSAATQSLARTPEQMPLLRRHGVVDAGGAGLVLLLSALVEVVTGVVPTRAARSWEAGRASIDRSRAERAQGSAAREVARPAAAAQRRSGALGWPGSELLPSGLLSDAVNGSWASAATPPATALAGFTGLPGHAGDGGEPPSRAYEVMFLLEAPAGSLPAFRSLLDQLGDSLLVVGGDDLWNVHIHADDVGAVIEAGLAAGRPYRIRVSQLTVRTVGGVVEECDEPLTRAVVLVVEGEGVAELARGAGATALAVEPGATASTPAVVEAIRAEGLGEVVLIPGGERFRSVADAAAQEVRERGVRVAVVPVRAAVQALAALAVHDPLRRFDDDVVAMTAAAGSTRFGSITVAERQAMTSAGVCEPGDVLGLLDGDVVCIAGGAAEAAGVVVDRLLGGGGEMVTLVHGENGADVARSVRRELRSSRPDVECMVYAAGATSDMLLVGVE